MNYTLTVIVSIIVIYVLIYAYFRYMMSENKANTYIIFSLYVLIGYYIVIKSYELLFKDTKYDLNNLST